MGLVGDCKANARRFFVVAVAMGLTLSLVTPATAGPWEDGVPKKENAAKTVAAARAAGGNVTISGWATFSGQIMGGTKDKDDEVNPVVAETFGAEMIGADFIYRPENEDFFFRLEVTKIPVVPIPLAPLVGNVATRYALRFTAKGVEYEIRAQSMGATHSFGLFRCDEIEGMCEPKADLKGGYGTTGERIVVALPLEVLREDGTNVKEGDPIGVLFAHVAQAPYLGGPATETQILDDARLIKQPEVIVPEKSVKVTVGKTTKKANLKEGYFDVKFPKSLFRKKSTTVKTRTCLGKDCKNQKFKVKA